MAKLLHPKARKRVEIDLGDGDKIAVVVAAIPGYKMDEFTEKVAGNGGLTANRDLLAMALCGIEAETEDGAYPVEIDATTGLVSRSTIDALPVNIAALIVKEVLALNGFGAKGDTGKS